MKSAPIESNNPDAIELVRSKIKQMEIEYESNRAINDLVKQAIKAKNPIEFLAYRLAGMLGDKQVLPTAEDRIWAEKLLQQDFAGRVGVPAWWFTNHNAEIRRLKKRLGDLEVMGRGWDSIQNEAGEARLEDGRILVYFKQKPDHVVLETLKRSPFVFKWSPTRGAWSRKHSPTTNSEYFRVSLAKAMTGEIHV